MKPGSVKSPVKFELGFKATARLLHGLRGKNTRTRAHISQLIKEIHAGPISLHVTSCVYFQQSFPLKKKKKLSEKKEKKKKKYIHFGLDFKKEHFKKCCNYYCRDRWQRQQGIEDLLGGTAEMLC